MILFLTFCSQVLGMGEEWVGGNMAVGAGGGQKINILRKELGKHRHDKDLVILFTDRWDWKKLL